jgi:uncharacterized protein YeaO (DUF488 family)
MIIVKRVYEPRSAGDGYRILVDRLWPRGLTQEAAAVDLWIRDIAPTTGLRQWYGHDVERWPQFRERYVRELEGHGELLDLVLDIERHRKQLTLLYAARDVDHNEAQVLADVLRDRPRRARGR